jgi:3-oxoacyl-[acyl-carrier-protein] synthase II
MPRNVVITGIGLVTPLGRTAGEVLDRTERQEQAAQAPVFDTAPFHCTVCTRVEDFDAEACFPGDKTLRLMNRDARMGVVAGRSAMKDASVRAGEPYPGTDIALFGATGLAGLPVDDITRLVTLSAASDGTLDLDRLGRIALKRVRPVLSFKILANIPICFVSIFEGVCGENAVYAPWEGQGAQAIAAGIRSIRQGRAGCALVGGCDVKTHEFSFITLQQLGAFDSWREKGKGRIPGEGAAFLVLEEEKAAAARGARVYARIRDYRIRTHAADRSLQETYVKVLSGFGSNGSVVAIGSGDGDEEYSRAEMAACDNTHVRPGLQTKQALGDLFAAAAPVQVAIAAEMCHRAGDGERVVANCFGFGSEQAAFLLEAV